MYYPDMFSGKMYLVLFDKLLKQTFLFLSKSTFLRTQSKGVTIRVMYQNQADRD